MRYWLPLLSLVPFLVLGCGGDDDEEEEAEHCTVGDNSTCGDGLECQAVAGGDPDCFCSVDRNTGCDQEEHPGFVCEPTTTGNSGCFAPLYVSGHVFDIQSSEAIEGAHVVARDANNVAQSGVSVTDENGDYTLRVATLRKEDGTPDQAAVTLRADAFGYLGFPKPPRVALPVELSQASGDPLTVKTTTTDIGMIALPDTTGLGTVRGKVLADAPRGTVIVAGGSQGSGGGVTGVADGDGSYAVFNVPAGTVTVQGYKAGLQLGTRSADVPAGEEVVGIDLEFLGDATAVLDGKVEIVNPGAGKDTSVILVVDETFDNNTAHGETPPGLRAFPVSGDFQIFDVPDGNYVVLAAFENDNLVRDPDTAIGGTSIVRVTVSGGSMTIPESFKVTGALDVVSPDKEEVVSTTPTFVFADDSGEDHYEIVVFDAFGNLIWEDKAIPGVSGSKTVDVPYAGTTPLEAGMLYQFRATSIKNGGSPISRTEDLRGVFLVQ